MSVFILVSSVLTYGPSCGVSVTDRVLIKYCRWCCDIFSLGFSLDEIHYMSNFKWCGNTVNWNENANVCVTHDRHGENAHSSFRDLQHDFKTLLVSWELESFFSLSMATSVQQLPDMHLLIFFPECYSSTPLHTILVKWNRLLLIQW